MKKTALSAVFLFFFSVMTFNAWSQNFELRRGPQTAPQTEAGANSDAAKKEAAPQTDDSSKKNGAVNTDETVKSEEKVKEKKEKKPLFSKLSPVWFAEFGPVLSLNTDSDIKGAPSPINLNLAGGADFRGSTPLFLQARMAFSTGYYLWDGEHAQPAEIENRTATVLAFMLDFCAASQLKIKSVSFDLGAGLGIFARYGFLSGGVEADDKNPYCDSTASKDVSKINSDFYSDLNFLYPEITFGYNHKISEKVQAGGDLRFYIPLGSLISGKGFDGAMAALLLKISFI